MTKIVTNGYNLDNGQLVTIGYKLDEKKNNATGNSSEIEEIIKNFNKSSKQITQLFAVDVKALNQKKCQEYRQSIQDLRLLLDNLEARLDD